MAVVVDPARLPMQQKVARFGSLTIEKQASTKAVTTLPLQPL